MRIHSGYSFKPRFISSTAALCVFLTLLTLGNWQLARARQKEALHIQQVEFAEHLTDTHLSQESTPALFGRLIQAATQFGPGINDTSIRLTGHFVAGPTIVHDNRVYKQQSGYHLLRLFRAEGNTTPVLVNLGWAPLIQGTRAQLPYLALFPHTKFNTDIKTDIKTDTHRGLDTQTQTETGSVTITGLLYAPDQRIFTLKDDQDLPSEETTSVTASTDTSTSQTSTSQTSTAHTVRSSLEKKTSLLIQKIDFAYLEKALHTPLAPFVIKLTKPTEGLTQTSLVRVWPPQSSIGMTAEKHRGYAFQWFAMAAVVALLYLRLNITRDTPSA